MGVGLGIAGDEFHDLLEVVTSGDPFLRVGGVVPSGDEVDSCQLRGNSSRRPGRNEAKCIYMMYVNPVLRGASRR
jgi:hypothetical protein